MRRFTLLAAAILAIGLLAPATAHADPYVTVRPATPDYESPVRSGPVDLIVLHTTESDPIDPWGDYNNCAYLARIPNASVHWCVGIDGATPSVPEDRVAWTASHRYVNNRALQIEMAGRAADSAYLPANTLYNAAAISARWVREHNIPIRKLSTAELCAGQRGFIGHADVRGPCAANPDNHWDPGPGFDWDRFLSLVAEFAGQTRNVPEQPAPAPNPGPVGADVAQIQRIVGAYVDGVYGPNTRAKVAEWQGKLGVTVDGIWGPETQAATDRFFTWLAAGAPSAPGAPVSPSPAPRPTLRYGATGSAVRTLQRAVGIPADGIWGPVTDRAVRAFQRSHGLTVDGVVGPLTWRALLG